MEAALTPLSARRVAPVPAEAPNAHRLTIETNPDHLRVQIAPIWSAPIPRLKDFAGMTFLTLLGALAVVLLALLPIGLNYTRQALSSGDIGGISIGVLLLCLGSVPWFTGLNWLKQNLTSTVIESLGHRLVIKYQLSGLTYWQRSQPHRDIADIYSVPLTGEEEIVMVKCKSRPALAVAHNLSSQDSQLLTQTLQQWIDHYG